jgi:hypothetical protein
MEASRRNLRSAIPLKAGIAERKRRVRFPPEADIDRFTRSPRQGGGKAEAIGTDAAAGPVCAEEGADLAHRQRETAASALPRDTLSSAFGASIAVQ